MTDTPAGDQRLRRAGFGAKAIVWLVGIAACELVSRRYGGFVLTDGLPARVERMHLESGTFTLETLNGVVVWRREHPDRPEPKPRKEGFRIVVLGDSVLLPALLDDSQGAARLLERQLNKSLDGGPFEVVNLAEGGWNLTQEEQVLIEEGLELDPDLVLVGVTPNDILEYAYRDGQLLDVRRVRGWNERATGGLFGFLGRRSYFYKTYRCHQRNRRESCESRVISGSVLSLGRRFSG